MGLLLELKAVKDQIRNSLFHVERFAALVAPRSVGMFHVERSNATAPFDREYRHRINRECDHDALHEQRSPFLASPSNGDLFHVEHNGMSGSGLPTIVFPRGTLAVLSQLESVTALFHVEH